MKLAEIFWNGDEAEIWFSPAWRQEDLIVRLDAINDCIHILAQQYAYEQERETKRAKAGTIMDQSAQATGKKRES
jgi:hypothetical protein